MAPWCCAFDPRGSTRGSAAGEKCVAETVWRPSPLVVSRIGRSSSNEAPPKTSPAPRVSRLQKCSRARRPTGNRRARWLVPAARERATRRSPSRAAEARACVAPSRAAAQCPDARRRGVDFFSSFEEKKRTPRRRGGARQPPSAGSARRGSPSREGRANGANLAETPKVRVANPNPNPNPIPNPRCVPRTSTRAPTRRGGVALSCPPPPQPP